MQIHYRVCIGALGEMPVAGDIVSEYGYRFSIQSVENHRIGKLLIKKLNDADEITSDAGTNAASSE